MPPTKVGFPLASTELGAGKIPALTKAAALAEIMHDGMVLLGKGEPCTIPAGRTPPGQFLARTDGDTWFTLGTLMVVLPKFPVY